MPRQNDTTGTRWCSRASSSRAVCQGGGFEPSATSSNKAWALSGRILMLVAAVFTSTPTKSPTLLKPPRPNNAWSFGRRATCSNGVEAWASIVARRWRAARLSAASL